MTRERLVARAELVLDPRLADVWQLVWSDAGASDESVPDAVSEATLGALLRLAYVVGYADAKDESDDGALLRELGVRRAKATVKAGARRRRDRRKNRSSDR